MKSLQRGATLIELTVAIVIITSAAGTIVALLAMMSRNSAEIMVQSHSSFIANAYLSEIMAKSFGTPSNPDGQDLNREDAESVDDYPGCLADTLVRDQRRNLIARFSDYRVVVNVTQPGFPNPAGTVPAGDTRLIQIAVTGPYGDVTRLSGFRTRH
jgi:hypothetical protein